MGSILDALPREGAVFAGRTGAVALPNGRFLLVGPVSARIVDRVSEPPDNGIEAPDEAIPVQRPRYLNAYPALNLPSPVATGEGEGEGSCHAAFTRLWPHRDAPDTYVRQDPYTGGLIRVAQAIRNAAAAGQDAVALSHYLAFGDPADPEAAYQLKKAIQGIADAAQMFLLPIVAGDLTTRAETALNPRVEISAYTAGSESFSSTQPACQTPAQGQVIALVGRVTDDLSGSLYASPSDTFPPPIDLIAEGRVLEVMRGIGGGQPVGRGGLLITLARCCARAQLGARVTLPDAWRNLAPAALLFGEAQSRFVAFLPAGQVPELLRLAEPLDVPVEQLGTMGGTELLMDGLLNLNVRELG